MNTKNMLSLHPLPWRVVALGHILSDVPVTVQDARGDTVIERIDAETARVIVASVGLVATLRDLGGC